MQRKNYRSLFLLALLVVFFGIMLFSSNLRNEEVTELNYNDFVYMLKNKKNDIGEVVVGDSSTAATRNKRVLTIKDQLIEGFYRPKGQVAERKFRVTIPYIGDDLMALLQDSGKNFKAVKEEENIFTKTLLSIIPWIIFLGIIWFIMVRQLQSTGNRAMSFGKSRAKLNENKKKVTFADVAGVAEAKLELTEIIDFLKDPKKFHQIGAKIPRGVLLAGPPGTGKTLLAKAISGEADVPFFSISGSDFVEMFVGVGASRVRDLFEQGKKNAPCIIFIDEIDAVGRLRGAGLGGGHDEREQTLNQMLVEMDGFETNDGVIVIAATNRPDVLDPALLRPGRFDRQVIVDLPDLNGRKMILEVHAAKIPMVADIDLNVIARGTPGFTGADLANLVNEAALLAARRNKKKVTMAELEEAKDKVMMGPERKSFMLSESEKEVIAYHEAGHAILGSLMPHCDPVHKVTIIPRGRALGLTHSLPDNEQHLHNKDYWLDQIVMILGGRLAEEIRFNVITNGSSNDIEKATQIAKKMVMEWGMSDKVGPVVYGKGGQEVFIGRDYGQTKDYSESAADLLDQEIKSIINSCLKKGMDLLKKHKKVLNAVAEGLLSEETINGETLLQIIKRGGGPGRKPAGSSGTAGRKKKPTGTRKTTGGKLNPKLA